MFRVEKFLSYIPTNDGEPVINHKWVIQEELESVGEEPLKVGTEAKINVDHMEGMKGATATIDSADSLYGRLHFDNR